MRAALAVVALSWQSASAAVAAQLYTHGEPTAPEQYMLELVNRGRADPAAEAARFQIGLNEGITGANQISTAPKQPLAFNPQLLQAARGHSQWMLDRDIFAHVADGVNPRGRMIAAGYQPSSWGENIAWSGSSGSAPPEGAAVEGLYRDLFVDRNVPGRGHRVALMNDNFREMGIGARTGTFTSQGLNFLAVMVTQDFASAAANPAPFLVGVVYRDVDENGFYTVGEGMGGVTVAPAGGTHYAVTSASGGYSIPLNQANGSLVVAFSGGGLGAPVNRTVTLAGRNVKLDLDASSSALAAFGFVAGSAGFSPGGAFQADLYGEAGLRLAVQSSQNLTEWSSAGEVAFTGATARFTDTQAASQPRRYYRAIKMAN